MPLEDTVVMFVYVVTHQQKNRTISGYFYRSSETVSRQFNLCLKAILKLHGELPKKPSPILQECKEDGWKYFKVP